MSMLSRDRLAEVFVDVADTLVDDFDLVEFLQRVASHTSDLRRGARGRPVARR